MFYQTLSTDVHQFYVNLLVESQIETQRLPYYLISIYKVEDVKISSFRKPNHHFLYTASAIYKALSQVFSDNKFRLGTVVKVLKAKAMTERQAATINLQISLLECLENRDLNQSPHKTTPRSVLFAIDGMPILPYMVQFAKEGKKLDKQEKKRM
jgi:hypothetical protein